MKIYFAASIKGGRELGFSYEQIVIFLKKYGCVLSEHVASSDLTVNGESLVPDVIHARDLDFIDQADLIIAEVTVPSLGVGYEIRYAIERGKQVVCVCHEDKRNHLSAMVCGSPGVSVHYYCDHDDLQNQLTDVLSSHETSTAISQLNDTLMPSCVDQPLDVQVQ